MLEKDHLLNPRLRPVEAFPVQIDNQDYICLQDPESYEIMRNAIGILKLISQGEADVRSGRSKPQETLFAEIEGSLRKA